MAIDKPWFEMQVRRFHEQRQVYVEFCRVLQEILARAVRALEIGAMVQVRSKEVPSFAEKCLRKQEKYMRPADQFTDLCGARVIVESKGQLESVCDYLRRNFEIDAANSEDVCGRLGTGEFGYLSIHSIVSFKGEGADYHGVTVPPVLLERRTEAQARAEELRPGPKYQAEVQVRTFLQHAWATLVHDNLYKAGFKAPPHLEREAARIAAKLEDTDDSFARLIEAIRFYRSCYGAYLSPENIREEMELLEAVRRYDPDNPKLAHKIGRLALAIADWPKASQVLADFRATQATVSAGILRDLGVALARQDDPGGRKLIREAVSLDPADADACCELGDACFATDLPAAADYYEQAFHLRPTYPRALRNFVQAKIHQGEATIVSLVGPHLEAAGQTCREWARVGVHLPNACYDLGFFELLLGRPYESLTALARAADLSATEFPIQENCGLLAMIQEKLRDQGSDLAPQVDWGRRFLLAASVAKILARKEAAGLEVERLEAAARKAGEALENLKHVPDHAPEALAEAEKRVLRAREAHQQGLERLEALRVKTGQAAATYLANPNPELHGKYFVATPRHPGEPPIFVKEESVVIVAGGCDRSVEEKISEYRGLLEFGFEGFEGIIVSGGTISGISGIVGDLPNPGGAFKKVAYLPEAIPRSDRVHEAYTIYDTPGHGYSPLQTLQTWIDLLASGVRPGSVKVIGINGGDLAAFEYRLGLVMGAKVGILRESGRAATCIADDPDWRDHRGLLLLPRDEETVRLFLQPPAPAHNIAPADKERLARAAHAEHRQARSTSLLPVDPVLAEWEDLIPAFKVSSLQQVDHIEAKLARLGLKLRKVAGREIRLYRFQDKEKIEALAKLEHARWNMERLLDGWTPGERDPKNKKSPYLVPWDELTPEAKAWDRQAITSLPRQLRDLGYEIYDPAEEPQSL